MLSAKNLRKAFGQLQAVSDVSLEAAKGEVLGLLGPNGAGKTTTIGMLAGLVPPDAGEVRIAGEPIVGDTSELKRKLGLVPQELALFEELTATANLDLFGALYGLSGAALARERARVFELVGLADRAKDRAGTFSGGMKRRLNLAAALMHDPDVILLDEPTVGVDPQSRNAIFDNLESLKAAGKTLLYTTHYMEEAARLCDRIAIMDHGKVIAYDDLSGLLKLAPVSRVVVVELADFHRVDAVLGLAGVREAELTGNQLRLGIERVEDIPGLLTWLLSQGAAIDHVHTERPTLETVFLHLTGRSLRDA
ncbi:MAG: ABC transporter ATP-binding protein [Acidobacteria bacterium]|nr:ABC transporter ATP-binding protein [Acidobacteriota bacterium]